jgi:hypothetical protein
MEIEAVEYHLEFYTGGNTQVESSHMRGPFIPPRLGERVHLHKGSLTLDVTDVVHDFVEHEGFHLWHVLKIYGTEVSSVE